MFILIELLSILGILWLIANLVHYFVGFKDNNPVFGLFNHWRKQEKTK